MRLKLLIADRRACVAAATMTLAFCSPGRAWAQPAYDPMTVMRALVGHWTCSSVADGKTTRYTTDWELMPGGRWLRGVNRSGASESEDFENYDTSNKRWRTVDLEPDGSMSVLLSPPLDSAANVMTRSVYPDASQAVTFSFESANAYKLTFDFTAKGRHALWEDDCIRG